MGRPRPAVRHGARTLAGARGWPLSSSESTGAASTPPHPRGARAAFSRQGSSPNGRDGRLSSGGSGSGSE